MRKLGFRVLAYVHRGLYAPADGSYAVVASMGGAARHPDWCLNLRAHELAMVEIGRERVEVRACEVEGDERERLWRAMVDGYPGYDRYQEKTARRIPVVLLEPDCG